MPTPRRKRTSTPACKHKRSNTGTTCKPILARRFERICVGSVGAFCIAASCAVSDIVSVLVAVYGALLLTLSIGGVGLW